MQIVRFSSFLLLFTTFLFSQEQCEVDDRIMFAIATVERSNKTPIGYPYLISINTKKDQVEIRKNKKIKQLMLDRRTIDCENVELCLATLRSINRLGIKNLDLGSFQINQMFWSMKESNYFDVERSYYKACSIVESYNKKEWTWKNIAKYHSKTKVHNDRYKKALIARVESNS